MFNTVSWENDGCFLLLLLIIRYQECHVSMQGDLSTTQAADLRKYQIKDYLLFISVTDQNSILQSYIQTLIYHSNTH